MFCTMVKILFLDFLDEVGSSPFCRCILYMFLRTLRRLNCDSVCTSLSNLLAQLWLFRGWDHISSP